MKRAGDPRDPWLRPCNPVNDGTTSKDRNRKERERERERENGRIEIRTRGIKEKEVT